MAELIQTPNPGTRVLRCVGDELVVSLEVPPGFPAGRAFVRTDADGVCWKDCTMERSSFAEPSGANRFTISLPLSAVGVYGLKAYFMPDGAEEPLWPSGTDTIVKVAPSWTRRGCSIYTAFTRQFRIDDGRAAASASREEIASLDRAGYTVIPPSGTFRSLARRLDHIVGRLGFNILQLLPIHPVPTTYARMGRFGSPFASQDFLSVDPALAEFDESATPMDQFIELVDAVHARGARIFLDLPANHTGWASTFQTHHPEWFRRNPDGSFHSPGAWGVTWADLVELDFTRPGLREAIADVFLFWCAKGVDGFRCDAGYMIPAEVWGHVVKSVRQVFPDTVFLLEGLGGLIETTDKLLCDVGLDWAYSEIFQQPNRDALSGYLPAAIARSEAFGPLVNFAETHDNDRLASHGERWASVRTALAALLSQQGAFGITAGVEWFCRDKIDVHGAPPLNWGAEQNQCALISRLNAILSSHPAFTAGSHVELVTRGGGNVVAALRRPFDGAGAGEVLVAVNLDCGASASVGWPADVFAPQTAWDLITSRPVEVRASGDTASVELPPGGFAAIVSSAASLRVVEVDEAARVGSGRVQGEPAVCCNASCHPYAMTGGVVAFEYPRDSRRTVVVPPGFDLGISALNPFSAMLLDERGEPVSSCRSANGGPRNVAVLRVPAGDSRRMYSLSVVCHAEETQRTTSPIMALPPADAAAFRLAADGARIRAGEDFVAVLANRRGAMAQVQAAWGEIRSQYDAVLAINPDPRVPSDRVVFFTRCRAWIRHCGYSFELDASCLDSFRLVSGLSAEWNFTTPIGRGDSASISIRLELSEGENRARLCFVMNEAHSALADGSVSSVELVLRPDVEARGFHGTTLAYKGAERSYPEAVHAGTDGFRFEHSGVPPCEMRIDGGVFHAEGAWTYSVPHPIEAGRGLDAAGDLYSPGWFSAVLEPGRVLCLEAGEASGSPAKNQGSRPQEHATDRGKGSRGRLAAPCDADHAILLGDWLATNPTRLFVADRDELKTVIAGYPWFLDWGRDTLIVLRGLLASGDVDASLEILREFARFEESGTLPNIIHGGVVGNRDTSDAPLWFIVAAGDAMAIRGVDAVASLKCGRHTLADVMVRIVRGYVAGTPNGIKADPESGLVYSPPHFTWMDTNYPAGTPRNGYPVEIQALWIASLSILRERLGIGEFAGVEELARASLLRYFVGSEGWLADSLRVSGAGFGPAAQAVAEDALRPNQLLAVTLGAVDPHGKTARAIVDATESLLVPGAIRSLGDEPVGVPQPVWSGERLLNDPMNPYWGHYEGDEDTRRKPAYHNGTAWSWQFPLWCEAFALVGGGAACETARAVLASSAALLEAGCLGQLPEILDGDTPHLQRGCLAQAWGMSELQRVWRRLAAQSMSNEAAPTLGCSSARKLNRSTARLLK